MKDNRDKKTFRLTKNSLKAIKQASKDLEINGIIASYNDTVNYILTNYRKQNENAKHI